jgi:hypothetical protein
MADPVIHPRDEVEAALQEYLRLGALEEDWEAWADLFTDDALYEEHQLGTFRGRAAIKDWIVATMKDYAAMTVWIEWSIIDGNRIALYVWNNLPDPTGTGQRFGFPNTTFLEYAGGGKFSWEADYYNPHDAEKVFRSWLDAGGRRSTPKDHSLQGIAGWSPEPRTPAAPREEVLAEFQKYRERAALAVATGDWDQWAEQFTDDAHYREHHYGYFRSKAEIMGWINAVMQPFPSMEFPPTFALVDGNRVSSLIPNILPPPPGVDGYFGFDVNTILHYAGGGKWSYEEDVYSPVEAQRAIGRWIKAGGVIPNAG